MVVSGIMPDSRDDYEGDFDDGNECDSDKSDINDPRTHEHEAYQIAQANAGRAARRFRYGDDVDTEGNNHDSYEEDNDDLEKLHA